MVDIDPYLQILHIHINTNQYLTRRANMSCAIVAIIGSDGVNLINEGFGNLDLPIFSDVLKIPRIMVCAKCAVK